MSAAFDSNGSLIVKDEYAPHAVYEIVAAKRGSWTVGRRICDNFAQSLRGQGKYAEAEPLLISGYEGLQKLSPAISAEANFPEAGQRLMRLYTAWGKPEKAAEWRQRLERPEK
jgi:hypothetical protein